MPDRRLTTFLNQEGYLRFTGFKFDFKKFVDNVKWIYANKSTIAKSSSEAQRQEFFDTFGDYCDRIFVENFAPCWPEFDIMINTGVKMSKGIYQQDIGETDTCPYILWLFRQRRRIGLALRIGVASS